MPSRALTFLQEIRDAIRAHSRLVVVIGPAAVSSDYVRAEWQAALVEGKVVTPLLRLGTHDLLPPELRNLHCPDFRASRSADEALADLKRILREPIPTLAPLVGRVLAIPAHFQPRAEEMTRLAARVLYDIEHPAVIERTDRTTVVWGMGGSGKSVIAAAFARATTTRRVFRDGVFWVPVGETASALEVLRSLVALVPDLDPSRTPSEDGAVTALRTWLAERRALIVFDNVWSVEQVEPILDALGPNSRLVATTRDAGLATAIGAEAQHVGTLDDAAAIRQLADWVGRSPDDLPQAAADVARECGNLPFALALHGALAADGQRWEDLAGALRDADLAYAEKRFAGYPYPTLLRALQASVDALRRDDPAGAQRFLDVAAFQWDHGVPELALLAFWRHEGTGERDGRRLLVTLERKSLLTLTGQAPGRRAFLHDLMRDFVIAACPDEASLESRLVAAYRAKCAADWLSGPADGYFHRHILGHLERTHGDDETTRLLQLETPEGRCAWFEACDSAGETAAFIADLERRVRAAAGPGIVDVDRQFEGALILASLASQFAAIPSGLLHVLVRSGSMPAEEAFAAAQRTADPEARVGALLAVLDRLDDQHRGFAMQAAIDTARSRAPQSRARLLTSIVPHVDVSERGAILADAESAARAIGLPGYRAEALAALVPLVTPERRAALVVDAVGDVENEIATAGRNQGGFGAVGALLPYLDAAALQRVAGWVRDIPQEFERASAFARLARFLKAADRETWVMEGLALLKTISGNTLGVELWLRQSLPGVTCDELLDEALRRDPRLVSFVVRQASEREAADVTNQLAERALAQVTVDDLERLRISAALLPYLSDARRASVVRELLAEVGGLRSAAVRQELVGDIAPYCDDDAVPALRAAAATIDDADAVTLRLAALSGSAGPSTRSRLLLLIRTIAEPRDRLEALVAIASHLEGSERETALVDATAAAVAAFRPSAAAVAQLAELVTGGERVEVLNAALRWFFEREPSVEASAAAFEAISKWLPSALIGQCVGELLRRAEIEGRERRATTAAGERRGDPLVLFNVLHRVKWHIADEHVAGVLELARGIEEPFFRAGVMAQLVPRLAADEQATVLNAAVADSQRRSPTATMRRGVSSVAGALEHGGSAERAALVARALEAARSAHPAFRDGLLLDVARNMAPGTEQKAILREALDVALARGHEWTAFAIRDLEPSLVARRRCARTDAASG